MARWTSGDELNVSQTAQVLKDRGYHVHPLCSPNHACGSPGKVPHIRNWDSCTQEQADTFFPEGQHSGNLGVRVDHPLLVVDIDVKDEGDGLAQFIDIVGNGYSPTVKTPSGGFHYWFRVPDDEKIFCNRKLDTLIDTRSDGYNKKGERARRGQVVVPPSIHKNGGQYSWFLDQPPTPVGLLPVVPESILEIIRWTPSESEARPVTDWEAQHPVSSGADGFRFGNKVILGQGARYTGERSARDGQEQDSFPDGGAWEKVGKLPPSTRAIASLGTIEGEIVQRGDKRGIVIWFE